MLSWALGPSVGFFFLGIFFQWKLIFISEGANQKSFSLRRVEKVDQGCKKSVHNSEFLGSHGTQG